MSGHRQVRVATSSADYTIHIGAGLAPRTLALAGLEGRKLRLVTDSHLAAQHLPQLLPALGLTMQQVFVIPAGEPSKTWGSASEAAITPARSLLPNPGSFSLANTGTRRRWPGIGGGSNAASHAI